MEIKKVAFSTNDGVTIEGHFGHCQQFVIYSVNGTEIVKKEVLTAPEHTHGAYPKFMADNGVNVVITGGMGHKAFDLITANGGEVIIGATGIIEDVMASYLAGELKSEGEICSHHHGEGHDHHHN